MSAPAEPLHRNTANVCQALEVLLAADGWLTTRQVADAAGVHKNTAPDILEELASRGWVERRDVDGSPRWLIGPELPRIGLAYQRRLAAEAEALAHRTARLVGRSAALLDAGEE